MELLHKKYLYSYVIFYVKTVCFDFLKLVLLIFFVSTAFLLSKLFVRVYCNSALVKFPYSTCLLDEPEIAAAYDCMSVCHKNHLKCLIEAFVPGHVFLIRSCMNMLYIKSSRYLFMWKCSEIMIFRPLVCFF